MLITEYGKNFSNVKEIEKLEKGKYKSKGDLKNDILHKTATFKKT